MSKERQKFPIICTDCGKDSVVPFKPKPDIPVYCKECLLKHRNSKDAGKSSGEDYQKPVDVPNAGMLEQFANWQKVMSESYLESMKSYSEMMNKFGESWKKIWQK